MVQQTSLQAFYEVKDSLGKRQSNSWGIRIYSEIK